MQASRSPARSSGGSGRSWTRPDTRPDSWGPRRRAVPADLPLTLECPWYLLPGSSKINRVLGWRSALVEQPVARSVRWHLEHPPDEPDAGEAPAQAK
jgi:hypothetical protein